MVTNYDPIAEQYRRSKHQPWREHIECFTFMKLIGDTRGLNVLDVACGEGFYTRMVRRQGAAKVIGVDLSPGMVELASQQEARFLQGIEYIVGDARDLSNFGPVDLVIAAYLLNYASDQTTLLSMCRGITSVLKPGGRFVSVNCSPFLHFPQAPSYRKYGFETSVIGDWGVGTPIRWTFHLADSSFEIENYHLDKATHESVFREAGFREIKWSSPELSPQAAAKVPQEDGEYWHDLLHHSPIAFIECRR